MKKVFLALLLMVCTALVMWWSNPSPEKHQEKVMSDIKQAFFESTQTKNSIVKPEDWTMIEPLAWSLIQESVQVENYKVFSLTKFQLGTTPQRIGIGAFGFVWLAPQLREQIKKEITKYQHLKF